MLKLAVRNIFNFVILWLLVLALIAIGSDVWHLGLKERLRKADPRSALPIYADTGYAAKIYKNQKVADFDYVPFIEWRHKPYASETLNIDSRGYRLIGGQTPGTGANANGLTLGIFGSSTVWGTGVDDSSTIPAFFQNLNPDIRVTNYGERGFTSRQNLDELINLAVDGTMPQVVVFYNGYNEVWTHCNYAFTKSLNGHGQEQKLREALAVTEESRSSIYHYLVEPVVRLVFGVSGGKKYLPACSNDPARAEAVAKMIVENWEIAQQIVSRHGGQFYAFLQPHAHVGKPNTSYLDLSGDRVLRGEEFRTVYPLVQKLVREKNLAWFGDLSTALDGNQRYLLDDAHLGPDGNKIVAQQIQSFLKGKMNLAAMSQKAAQ